MNTINRPNYIANLHTELNFCAESYACVLGESIVV